MLILKGTKIPMQVNLNQVYDELDMLEKLPTASAYCQARAKIKPEIFKKLNDSAVNNFYRLYDFQTFKGKRLLSVDCSCINLPNEPEIKERYGVQPNGYFDQAQGFGSFLYDSLNEITINAELDRKKAEKQFIFDEHINYMSQEDIVLLDRGYSDYSVMAFFASKKIDFVIRFPNSGRFKALEDFMISEQNDIILEIPVSKNQKDFVKENSLSESLKIRFVKVDIGKDEPELLATTLFEESLDELKWLYNQRWGIEIYFDRLKNIFELERFSSKKVNGVQQDFLGLVLLTNMETVLIQDAQEEIKKKTTKRKKEYKVNRSVSYSVMSDYLIFMLINDDERVYDKLEILFKTNPVIVRPGRTFPRRNVTNPQKLRYHLYSKRVHA
jgi:hypothetical protein